MKVKRIHGAINIEFEDKKFINFAILDRTCDECLSREGGCESCNEAGKPWREYYQLLQYDFSGNEDLKYENDPTKAVEQLVRVLQRYLDSKEVNLCLSTAK